MDSALTVACVYRTGGDYTSEYVWRLRDAFRRHCQTPHRFVCLTNGSIPHDIERVPLRHNWPGWWSKLEVFYLPGPVVYADLDTLILNDITDICAYPHKFSILKGWAGMKAKAAGAGPDDFNSSFMAWNQDLSHIPAAFSPDKIAQYQEWLRWGDQGFIQDYRNRHADKLQDLFPGRFVHYKTHVRRADKSPGPAPQGASVVCFSGKPRPQQINWTLPAS